MLLLYHKKNKKERRRISSGNEGVGILSPPSPPNHHKFFSLACSWRVMYYERFDVRSAILDFATFGTGGEIREMAIYNHRLKSIQRYESKSGAKSPLRPTASTLDHYSRIGATAFYISYWRYVGDYETPVARDLVWTVRPQEGGLKASKQATKMVLDAFKSLGIEPWVKYDGDRGFDIILPLEAIPHEAWMGDLASLDFLHHQLSDFITSHLSTTGVECRRFSPSSLQIKTSFGTSLLSELRVRRGLLLAPMSLNPRTSLISVPVNSNHIESFTVLQATPQYARPAKWEAPSFPCYALLRFAPALAATTQKNSSTPVE